MSRVERQRHKLKLIGKTWGEWREIQVTAEFRASSPHLKHVSKVFANNRLEVHIFNCSSSVGGVAHAVFARHGLIEPVETHELQRAKADLFGRESYGVELYPPGLANVGQNVRHLWVLPTGYDLPFGFNMASCWGGE